MSLRDLRIIADAAHDHFVTTAKQHGHGDEFAAYRNEASWPDELADAFNAFKAATHAFYTARDGDKGFLGSRGRG